VGAEEGGIVKNELYRIVVYRIAAETGDDGVTSVGAGTP
jgi:hypothetical protein